MIFNIIFFSLLIILLLWIAVYDYSTSYVPNKLMLIFFGCGVIYYIYNLNDNWYIPLISSVGLFILFFILFIFTGENMIGGADMKIICISLLMCYDFNTLYSYLIYLCIFSLFAYIEAKIKKIKVIRIAPHLCLAILVTLIPINFISKFIIILLFLISILIYNYLFFKEEFYGKKNYFIF